MILSESPPVGPDPSTGRPQLRYAAVLFLAAVLLAAGSIVQYLYGYTHSDLSGHAWGSDDAYISYRYARNLAEGHGLVFNPGERVEGYSNFLYVLLISLGCLSGMQDAAIYPFATLINLGFMLGAVLLFARFVRSKLGDVKSAAGVLLFALSPIVWVWVASGMETALVTLLQVALVVAIDRLVERESSRDLAACLVIMIGLIVARADGFVTVFIGVVYLLLRGRRRIGLITLGVLALAMAVYTLIRMIYYGNPLPNTFYVKVSGNLPRRVLFATVELARLSVYDGLLLYLAIIALSVYRSGRDMIRDGLRTVQHVPFESFFAVSWLVYWLYIGGDFFGERFLVILIPLGLFLFLRTVEVVKPGALVFPILLLGMVTLSPVVLDPRLDYSTVKYDRWVTLGVFLRERNSGQTIAIDAAGKVPFYSGLEVIDMLGLNDPVISHAESSFLLPGHNKFDPDYILSRRPDLIAAWMAMCRDGHCDRLDMILGMSEAKYVAAGYRIKYLLNTTKDSSGEDILDVSDMDRSDVIDRIFEGRGYGVLERINHR